MVRMVRMVRSLADRTFQLCPSRPRPRSGCRGRAGSPRRPGGPPAQWRSPRKYAAISKYVTFHRLSAFWTENQQVMPVLANLPQFLGLVLDCIDADFWKYLLVLQDDSRSTNCAHSVCASNVGTVLKRRRGVSVGIFCVVSPCFCPIGIRTFAPLSVYVLPKFRRTLTLKMWN